MASSKADLAKQNEKTRQVKEEDEAIKDKAKEVVHDVKKGVKDLANKTEDLDLKDVPDRLIPSAEKVDAKLAGLQESLDNARTSKVGDKDLTKYGKIQQVFKDADNIIQDNRNIVQAISEDGTLSDTAQHAVDLAKKIGDQSFLTLDKLWSNWAALLAVVAGSGAGSWKSMLQESGNLLNQLRHTQDFIRLLTDLRKTVETIASRATTKDLPVGEKLDELNQQWEKQRDKLLEDWKKIWDVLAESPLWKQLVAKGKALKGPATDAADETKEKVKEAGDKIANSEEVKKLKEDFKNIIQLIVGKDGPSVQPFLDYCSGAYEDIVENEDFQKWADEMENLYDSMAKKSENKSAYDKDAQKLYELTKDLLDNTVHNSNLKLAMRESKKLMKAAKKDPATRKLIEDSTKLLAHISDKKGVNLMDPHLLGEIRAVLVPILLDHFDNAPLPNFHGYDSNALGKYDYTLSEIRLGATGLVPSKVKIEFRYKAEANPSQLKVESQQMLMYLEASDIQVAFKDVKWVYNRHTIPRFTDSGTIDLATAGKGITLKLKAQMHDYQAPEHAHSLGELLSEPKEHKMFTVLKAECEIDDFHVRVSDAGGASVFYEMLAGIWGTKIKHQLEAMIEEKMNLLASKFNTQLYDIVRRATQPSLAQETKDAIISAGQSAAETVKEKAEEVKSTIQSM